MTKKYTLEMLLPMSIGPIKQDLCEKLTTMILAW